MNKSDDMNGINQTNGPNRTNPIYTKLRAAALSLSVVIVSFVLIGALLGQTRASSSFEHLSIFSEVLNRITNEYVETPDLKSVQVGALRGLVESLDPYSAYFTPAEFEEYQKRDQKSEADIGVVLSKDFRLYIVIISTLPESPAERAGLYNGDVLESIGGFSTREMSVEQASVLIGGEPGTAITLSVIKPGQAEAVEMELVRSRRRNPKILTTMLEDRIGYAKVASFHEGLAKELSGELAKLGSRGARSLVLDLRGAADGEMTEGIAAARLFLNSGVIVYTRGQTHPQQTYEAEAGDAVWNTPIAVLIDRGTAGPAEIVASALLDNRRAEVLGVRSFGKGSLQELIPLENGAALLLSVAKYYRPSGASIQDSAVMPSVPVPPANPFERPTAMRHALPAPGDRVVNRAVDALRKQLPAV